MALAPLRMVQRVARRSIWIWRPLAFLSGVVFLLGLLGLGATEVSDHLLSAERYRVKSIAFVPTAHVQEDEIRAILDLEPEANIFQVDLDDLNRRLQAHPWVAQGSVHRVLPDTLEVEIHEKVAQAVLLAEHFYLVDEDGRPFKRLAANEGIGLPIVTGISREELAEDRPGALARLANALEVNRLYLHEGQQAATRPEIGEIHLGRDGSLTLFTREHASALEFGRDRYQTALMRWDVLRAALGTRLAQLEVAHLDAPANDGPTRVVARFRTEASDETNPNASQDDADSEPLSSQVPLSGSNGADDSVPRS
jgi:cell division protein FtsQ